jgi:hypothetical protein
MTHVGDGPEGTDSTSSIGSTDSTGHGSGEWPDWGTGQNTDIEP